MMKKRYLLLMFFLGTLFFQGKCFAQITITGDNNFCFTTEHKLYSTEEGMSNYNWEISEGGSIVSKKDSNVVEVEWKKAGEFVISVSYTDLGGVDLSPELYNVKIDTATKIITQPQAPGMIQIGSDFTLTVEAEGKGLSYQWQKDGEDISGALDLKLEFPNAQEENNGEYRVIVKGTSCGSDTSLTVSIRIGNVIYIEEAGSLERVVKQDSIEVKDIYSLTIVGVINAADIRYIRDKFPNIEDLDLSETKVAAYTGPLGTYYGSNVSYNENELPAQSFFRGGYPSQEGSLTLKSIALPDSLTSIGYAAFMNCKVLSSITNMTGSLKSIESFAFADCDSLKSMTFSENLERIGNSCFQNCMNLESVSFPENLKVIKEYAFYYCINLTDVELFEKLDTIERGVFESCSKLKNVTLPASLNVIEERAFYGCTSLKEIKNKNEKPQIITEDVFKNVPKSECILRVPKLSIDTYKEASVWEDFYSIIGLDDVVGITDVSNESTLKIYPNPTTGYIYIESENSKPIQKSVYDVYGRLLLETKDSSINLSTYPNGVYLIIIENKIHKVIKR